MIHEEEIEPYYHDDFLWIPRDQQVKKIRNLDEALKELLEEKPDYEQ